MNLNYLFIDNLTTIDFVKFPKEQYWTKHIDVKLVFIRDLFFQNTFIMKYIKNKEKSCRCPYRKLYHIIIKKVQQSNVLTYLTIAYSFGIYVKITTHIFFFFKFKYFYFNVLFLWCVSCYFYKIVLFSSTDICYIYTKGTHTQTRTLVHDYILSREKKTVLSQVQLVTWHSYKIHS